MGNKSGIIVVAAAEVALLIPELTQGYTGIYRVKTYGCVTKQL